MKRTKIINIKNGENFDVYIGRTGHGHDGYFGNPYYKHSRRKNIQLFTEYALDRIQKDKEFRRRVKELNGKVLGCFCAPKECHGDVLAKLAQRITLEDDVLG